MDIEPVERYVELIRKMALAVYEELRCGYQEIIYKEALMVELRNANVPYDRERYVPIFYKGKNVIGTGKADVVVMPEDGLLIPIECKNTGLKEDDRQQLRTYMNGIGDSCRHGILIRFPQPGKKAKADALEFYWARRGTDGSPAFYRREADGTWALDEAEKSHAPKKQAQAKMKSSAT